MSDRLRNLKMMQESFSDDRLNMLEVFPLVQMLHEHIEDCGLRGVQHLRLEGLGAYGENRWAASFDSIIDDDEWYEDDRIEEYPYSARAFDPLQAIQQAASKLLSAMIANETAPSEREVIPID